MSYYMIQAAYTPEAIAKLVRNPQDRFAALDPMFKKAGGTLEHAWFAFGDYDVVVICQMPDNVSAAAVSFAAAAGGALRAIRTTPLMTAQEGIVVMKKATTMGYEPPKG